MYLELSLQNVLVLLTLQLAVFGWRINREIAVGDQGRRVWFPVSDYVNIVSMFLLLVFCIVNPLLGQGLAGDSVSYSFPSSARAIFGGAIILLVFHPLSMVAHYGLLNTNGRPKSTRNGKPDYAYCPPQEKVLVILSLVSAILVVGFIACS